MIDIRKQYIRLLYPVGRYDRKEKILINRWTKVGFLEDVEELNALKMAVLFEQAINIFSSTNVTNLDFEEYEMAVFPIIRRIVPYLNEDVVVDIKTIINYVKFRYKTVLNKIISEQNHVNYIDYETVATVEISDELIKEFNKK